MHENVPYDPVPDRPYCAAYLLVAEPGNPTLGEAYHKEQGVMQVNLQYPPLVGTLACALRAEAIRALFKRGSAFSDGGVTVQIDRTPEIDRGEQVDGRWMQIVRIRWHADIFTA